ncbi:hypothetical protein [Sedimentimonas flavescens]|uniref:hypothetical protein n=1 Tax=Sedimentimonas flavescens TaxID=2851012 RepID=UPI001C4A4626|nr:hypothetical protein [Sedimentimonas flavescens]MBW0159587.1 hypothetical protein [Sedimentimonas flavescens]
MQVSDLARVIWTLDPDTPKHRELERLLEIGVGFGNPWYGSQREHWLGWLGDYHSPGAYNRSRTSPTEARSVYNRINCAPMLFWLCEAAGVEQPALEKAFDAVAKLADGRVAAQCGALRREIPWGDTERLLLERSKLSETQIALADEVVSASREKLRRRLGLPVE